MHGGVSITLLALYSLSLSGTGVSALKRHALEAQEGNADPHRKKKLADAVRVAQSRLRDKFDEGVQRAVGKVKEKLVDLREKPWAMQALRVAAQASAARAAPAPVTTAAPEAPTTPELPSWGNMKEPPVSFSRAELSDYERAAHLRRLETKRALNLEEFKRNKYGEPMALAVRDVNGRRLDFQFRSATRLSVLMTTVCKRFDLNMSEARFVYHHRRLRADDTPVSVGLTSNAVIEVDTEAMRREKLARETKEREDSAAAEVKEKQERRFMAQKQAKKAKKLKRVKASQKLQAQMKRDHERRKKHLITLKFVNSQGKEAHLAYKRENWLDGLLQLVCQRFGTDPAKTQFLRKDTMQPIHPHDTAESLQFIEGDIILLRSD